MRMCVDMNMFWYCSSGRIHLTFFKQGFWLKPRIPIQLSQLNYQVSRILLSLSPQHQYSEHAPPCPAFYMSVEYWAQVPYMGPLQHPSGPTLSPHIHLGAVFTTKAISVLPQGWYSCPFISASGVSLLSWACCPRRIHLSPSASLAADYMPLVGENQVSVTLVAPTVPWMGSTSMQLSI